MQGILTVLNNEKGSLMIIAIIVLMLLTLIGIAITTTASLELQIAANDKLHKTVFYKADGGIDIGAELLEQNLGCAGGFGENPPGSGQRTIGSVQVTDLNIWQNSDADVQDPVTLAWLLPDDADRHFFFPQNATATQPHTNLKVGGSTQLSTGNAIQMVSGYEGKGKGAAAAGAYIMYNMFSQHVWDAVNAESVIFTQWRHVIGQEGACNYP